MIGLMYLHKSCREIKLAVAQHLQYLRGSLVAQNPKIQGEAFGGTKSATPKGGPIVA